MFSAINNLRTIKTKNMKFSKLFLAFLLLAFNVSAQTNMPDDAFENWCESLGYGDGVLGNDTISTSIAATVTDLPIDNVGISDLTGIEAFVNLTSLNCANNNLSNINISFLGNNLTIFNATNNPDLYCITVSDTAYAANHTGFFEDSFTSYSTNCDTAFGCMDPLSCYFSTTYSIDTVAGGSCFYSVTTYDTLDLCDSYLFGGINRTVTGSYTNVLTTVDGCDSNVVLSLTIRNSTASYDTTSVLVCDSLIWNNLLVNVSGDYQFSAGSNVAGCDSTAWLHAIIEQSNSGSSFDTACDSHLWNSILYTNSGIFSQTLVNAAGCDSIHTLNLTIYDSYDRVDTQSHCNSYLWPANGVTYISSNSSAFVLYQTVNGCDSLVTLNLTISSSVSSYTQLTKCDSYTWIDGQTYTATGLVIYNSITPAGCTSVDSLDLTINYSNSSTDNVGAQCDSYTWIDGVTYTTSNSSAIMIYNNAANCDSTVTLNLTINYRTTDTTYIDSTVCNLYVDPTGNQYTATGIWSFPLTNSVGCDSIIKIDLTVNFPDSSFTSVDACNSYTWNGTTYSTSVVDYFNTQTVGGCDSVAVLDLFIGYDEVNTTVVTACDNYVWFDAHGDTIFTALNSDLALTGFANGVYGLDGIFIDSDTLTNVAGCDSIEILHLTLSSSYLQQTAPIEVFASDSWMGPDSNLYTTSVLSAPIVAGTAVNGCDSVVLYKINIAPEKRFDIIETDCDTYTWIIENQLGVNDTTVYTSSASDSVVYYVIHTFDNDSTIQCDSVVYLHLTITNSEVTTDTIAACNSYTWINGVNYTSSNYTADSLYQTIGGCDSLVTLHLTINYSDVSTDVQKACDSYTWTDGITYTSSNTTATDTFLTIHNCDSVVTLDLTINYSYSDTLTPVISCDSYYWDANLTDTLLGTTYFSSGLYTYSDTTIYGCDSLILLDITIDHSYTNTESFLLVCDSFVWMQNGQTYYTSNSTDSVNWPTVVGGCDSIIYLDLSMIYSSVGTSSVDMCDSYIWNSDTITSSGDYIQHFPNAVGCDSAHTLTVIINYSNTGSTSEVECDAYSWNGTTYTTSGVYTYTYDNVAGCDSVHTLNLTIDNTVVNHDTIIACYEYAWQPILYLGSTSYWTFDTTSTFNAGTNSLTHTVYENSINSSVCTDVSKLYLTINPLEYGSDSVVACDSYLWEGNSYTSTGIYVDTIDGTLCDSVATLTLTINNSTSSTDSVGVHCDEYTWIDGNVYTQTDNTTTYTDTNSIGCDSVITLDLIIINSTESFVNESVCASYYWPVSDTTYTTSGIHSHTYDDGNSVGCDSTVWLTLTINDRWVGIVNMTECISYEWQGETYTNDTVVTASLLTVNGCDSIVTLNLTIYNSTSTTDVITACDSYTWIDGVTYTSSDSIASVTLLDALGCDSIVTLNLTIKNSTSSIDVHTACDSFVWFCDGNTYTSSNDTAFYIYTNAAGCDSIVTLNLTINNSTSYTDNVGNYCGSYTWIDGNIYTVSNSTATHTVLNAVGCDSVITLNLIINDELVVNISSANANLSAIVSGGIAPYSYLWTGPINSANAIVTPVVSGNYCVQVTDAVGCVSTQICENVTVSAVNDLHVSKFNIYPNPTTDFLTLDFYATIKGNYSVKIISSNGEQVYEDKILDFNGDYSKNINLSKLAKGNYIIQIHSDHQVVYRKILLQ
jgi:hypothetical protein